MDLQEASLPALRSRLSDVWVPEIAEVLEGVLTEHYNEAVDLVTNNRAAALQQRVQQWKDDLAEAKRPYYLGMAKDGWDWAAAELGDASALDGKEKPEIDPQLLPYRLVDGVDDFIEEMGEFEAETTRRQVTQKYAALRQAEETYTPAQISKRLSSAVSDLPAGRANTITRTSTIWNYNEGAMQQYRRGGVKKFRWFATEDDRTCEFCMAIDGDVVGTQSVFAEKGSTFKGLEGGELDIAWKVEHPPLHAHCRCTILAET